MWQVYVFGLLAGLFGTNGVPSFVKGVLGKKYDTPFGKASPATTCVIWGWANFVVAGIFIHYSHFHGHVLRAFGSVAIGALVAGLLLANYSSKS
jgi:hypothetical protein